MDGLLNKSMFGMYFTLGDTSRGEMIGGRGGGKERDEAL